jgi:hypothetical protein
MKYLSLALVFVLLITMLCSCASDNGSSAPEIETITEEEITLPPPEADRLGEEIYKNHPDLTPVNYDSPAILPKSDDMGKEYTDSLTFICDSPTYWMWPWGLLEGGENSKSIWTGPEGTMTLAYQSTYCILDPYDRVEKPIRQVVEEHKPEYLIIAVGINGVSFMDEEEFKADYRDLVSDIKEISLAELGSLEKLTREVLDVLPSDYRNRTTNDLVHLIVGKIYELSKEKKICE